MRSLTRLLAYAVMGWSISSSRAWAGSSGTAPFEPPRTVNAVWLNVVESFRVSQDFDVPGFSLGYERRLGSNLALFLPVNLAYQNRRRDPDQMDESRFLVGAGLEARYCRDMLLHGRLPWHGGYPFAGFQARHLRWLERVWLADEERYHGEWRDEGGYAFQAGYGYAWRYRFVALDLRLVLAYEGGRLRFEVEDGGTSGTRLLGEILLGVPF